MKSKNKLYNICDFCGKETSIEYFRLLHKDPWWAICKYNGNLSEYLRRRDGFCICSKCERIINTIKEDK